MCIARLQGTQGAEQKLAIDNTWLRAAVPNLHGGYAHAVAAEIGEIFLPDHEADEVLKKELQEALSAEDYQRAASIKKASLHELGTSSSIKVSRKVWNVTEEIKTAASQSDSVKFASFIAEKASMTWQALVEGSIKSWQSRIYLATEFVYHCLKHASSLGDNKVYHIIGHVKGKACPIQAKIIYYSMVQDPRRKYNLAPRFFFSSLSFPHILASMTTNISDSDVVVQLSGASNSVWALGKHSGMLHTLNAMTEDWKAWSDSLPLLRRMSEVTDDANDMSVSWLPWTDTEWFDKLLVKAHNLLAAGKIDKTQYIRAIEKVVLSGRFFRSHAKFERSIEEKWMEAFVEVLNDEVALKFVTILILEWSLMSEGFNVNVNWEEMSLLINITDPLQVDVPPLHEFMRADEKLSSRLKISEENLRLYPH
ncbi:hypothetical protein GUITHDRAFT_139120 [Guillardia theta CCMP2712]|uniref:Uncharacterized protein n=1 Tax=Guillardia theta (strain CCMP2712) TaxID=905079 RepID=L1JAS7_GUITC|nr:hypothetical protein GUITHDRAFT_139120 [Guillardia theta CCMP2712]EKX45195.1 hypothetical protein GUITHDRAFT_139120 [Guillardia theta CCMP2712]|eukprot:XP_005832175.1 hypothetical protein GUITHDRAFT_139120 [Guillardia theta CCMP2712]